MPPVISALTIEEVPLHRRIGLDIIDLNQNIAAVNNYRFRNRRNNIPVNRGKSIIILTSAHIE